jgi:hypothetical protein
MIVLISIFDTIVNLYKPRIPGQLYQICIKITIFNISRRDKNKERAKSQRLSSFFVLPWKDACLWRLSISACCIMLYIICLKICRLSVFVIIFAVEVVIVR